MALFYPSSIFYRWSSHVFPGFPSTFPWLSYGFPMVFIIFLPTSRRGSHNDPTTSSRGAPSTSWMRPTLGCRRSGPTEGWWDEDFPTDPWDLYRNQRDVLHISGWVDEGNLRWHCNITNIYIYTYIYILCILYLVGGLVAMNFIFPEILGVAFIIPIDELIFFRGVAQPPTSIYLIYIHMNIVI